MNRAKFFLENGIGIFDDLPFINGFTTNAHGDFAIRNGHTERSYASLEAVVGKQHRLRMNAERRDRILVLGKKEALRLSYPPCDGIILINDEPGIRIRLESAVADCPILVICEPERKAIALIHSGWEGTMRNIAGKAMRILKNLRVFYPHAKNVDPSNVQVFRAPSICPDCYEFKGPEERYFPGYIRNGYLDLGKKIDDQLIIEGVLPEHIFETGYCSAGINRQKIPGTPHCSRISRDASGNWLFASHRRFLRKLEETSARNLCYVIV